MISDLLLFGAGYWMGSSKLSNRDINDDENGAQETKSNTNNIEPVLDEVDDESSVAESSNIDSTLSSVVMINDMSKLDRLIRMNDFTTLTPRSVVRGGYLTCGVVPFNLSSLVIKLKESIRELIIDIDDTRTYAKLLGGSEIYCLNIDVLKLVSGEETNWDSNVLYDSPRWPNQVESFMTPSGGALTIKGPFTTAFYDLLLVKGRRTQAYSITYPTNMLVHYYRNSVTSGPYGVEYRQVDTDEFIHACEQVNA